MENNITIDRIVNGRAVRITVNDHHIVIVSKGHQKTRFSIPGTGHHPHAVSIKPVEA